MPIDVKVVNFRFATGATSTDIQYVGNKARVMVYVSNVTGWNAAAGNATIALRGSFASGVSHVSIPGASITTETIGAMYVMSQAAGVNYMSVGFGTATSGAGTITCMFGYDA